MLRSPQARESWLAEMARNAAVGVDALYHGTRYPAAIIESATLKPAYVGDPVVCFTRSSHEAAKWAMLPRDHDEGRGAIFVFDRQRLLARYRLDQHCGCEGAREYEENVWDRVVRLQDALVSFVSEPFPARTQLQRTGMRAHILALHQFNGYC